MIDDAEREAREILHAVARTLLRDRPIAWSGPVDGYRRALAMAQIAAALRKRDEEIARLRLVALAAREQPDTCLRPGTITTPLGLGWTYCGDCWPCRLRAALSALDAGETR